MPPPGGPEAAGTGPPLRHCSHSTPRCRVFQLAGRGLRVGTLWAPRKHPGRRGLFGESESLLPRGRVGVAAAGGIGSGRPVALPAWPPVFCLQGSLSSPSCPLPSLSSVRRSVDGVTRGALERDAEGRGRRSGRWSRPRQLWVRLRDLGQARRGRWGCPPGAARLAASGGGGITRRSPRVFAPGWGAPRRSGKLHPRPQPPSPLASLAAGLQAGSELFFFSFLKKEAPDPHCLSGVGLDVCIGVGGAQISPLQARPPFS